MAFLKLLACLCLLCGVAGLFVVFNDGFETPLRVAGAVEVIFAVTFAVMALAVAGIYEHLMPVSREPYAPHVVDERGLPSYLTDKPQMSSADTPTKKTKPQDNSGPYVPWLPDVQPPESQKYVHKPKKLGKPMDE